MAKNDEQLWTIKGATLSEKSAREEYKLKNELKQVIKELKTLKAQIQSLEIKKSEIHIILGTNIEIAENIKSKNISTRK